MIPDLGEDLISLDVSRIECYSSCNVLKVGNLDAIECGVVGVFIAPTTKSGRWKAAVAWRIGQCPVAHRTVRCAMRQQPSNGHFVVVGAINTPTTPHSMASKFLHFYTLQELAFNTRHTQEIKSSPNSTQSFSDK